MTFQLEPGEFVGLVGESGSGKSTLGNAMLRLLHPPGGSPAAACASTARTSRQLPRRSCARCAGSDISTVFQSSMNSLNPVMTIEAQFRDVIEQHTDLRGDGDPRRGSPNCSRWSRSTRPSCASIRTSCPAA